MATNSDGKSPKANVLLGTVTIGGNGQNPQVPEPGTLFMAGTALVALGVMIKKKQTKA